MRPGSSDPAVTGVAALSGGYWYLRADHTTANAA
jgi:hypothetical protein